MCFTGWTSKISFVYRKQWLLEMKQSSTAIGYVALHGCTSKRDLADRALNHKVTRLQLGQKEEMLLGAVLLKGIYCVHVKTGSGVVNGELTGGDKSA